MYVTVFHHLQLTFCEHIRSHVCKIAFAGAKYTAMALPLVEPTHAAMPPAAVIIPT